MTDPATDPVIALRGVSVGYTDRAVVHDVDLVVQRGEVVAVLGEQAGAPGTHHSVQLINQSGSWEMKPIGGVASQSWKVLAK